MADLFAYLHWRGDLTFTQDPVNPVDALIFSALSYISFSGSALTHPDTPIQLKNAADDFFALPANEQSHRVQSDLNLLKAAAQTRRFGYSMLVQYRDLMIPEEQTQFAAMTFLLDDGSAFLAFRGTDYSLIGWKEDFNMSFHETIPSQRLALAYTKDIAGKYSMPLLLGGHSKGGNLAVFAGVKVDPSIQKRIKSIYNNDGPGFSDYLMNDPAYQKMVPKIKTFVPQSSVIGMLLEHQEPYAIIRSKQMGLLQHELYSWEISGPGFVRMEQMTANSRLLNHTIKNWLSGMSNEERNEFADALFTLLSNGDVDNVLDILHPRNLRNYIHTINKDRKLRRILSSELLSLIEAAKKTQRELSNYPQ